MTFPPAPRHARWLLAAYVAAVCVVVFQPDPSAAAGSVNAGSAVAAFLRVDGIMTPAVIEVGLNVVLFVPLTLLGAWAMPRVGWPAWIGLAVLATCFIETVQLLFLPGRSATFTDVVANTAGGAIGVLTAKTLAHGLDGRRPADRKGSTPRARTR